MVSSGYVVKPFRKKIKLDALNLGYGRRIMDVFRIENHHLHVRYLTYMKTGK